MALRRMSVGHMYTCCFLRYDICCCGFEWSELDGRSYASDDWVGCLARFIIFHRSLTCGSMRLSKNDACYLTMGP